MGLKGCGAVIGGQWACGCLLGNGVGDEVRWRFDEISKYERIPHSEYQNTTLFLGKESVFPLSAH